ncbi:DgaE family pyridoxal phosphate-dependent ammonia lyase [Paenibacillus sp. DMB20]|uniref:DgaE family pyridoxal phosphate-dependent ammonia lyase n=1 Tax=Paenibacillus sp. DMB20 TaxID=1642570 RepID=UPI0006275576|nr:DgaE family pyridoxal phosphate-dependent ammonia lyase [Paenibacillus sp. DMB20]KKO53882.1 L-seryl-tRNA selenium transferase [Paenibacillus sp. DMB20]
MDNSWNAKYGLKRVINASGRMSILGVSAPTDTVMEAMKQGGQRYVEIADLVDKAGDHVASVIGSEAAVVVNSASSGIALSVAAIVTRGNRRLSERLHQEAIPVNEIIVLKGHNVQYGAPVETMVYLGGGKLVEVGYANEGRVEHIEDAITDKTAAVLYVKSHHAVQKNMISVEEAWEVARRKGVPMIVDAAAEEDLQKYVRYSDLAIYSGSKAIEGPTSGIVAGKRNYIDWVKVQLHGIGRSMKVGKETTFGLLQALDEYTVKEDRSEEEKEALQALMPLNDLPGIKVTVVQDEAGRAIFRARVHIDPVEAGITAQEAAKRLQNGEIAIYTRDYGVRQGYFDIDPRPLMGDDLQVIEAKIRELTGGR